MKERGEGMRKRYLGVAALLLLSALLPALAAALQETIYSVHVTARETEPVALGQLAAWDFVDRLEHAGVSMLQAELLESEETEYSPVLAAGERVLQVLEDAELVRQSRWENTDLVPLLAAVRDEKSGEDTFQSFQVWRSIYQNPDGGELGLLLDHQTGELLAAKAIWGEKISLTAEEREIWAARWAGFCAEYYGMTLEQLKADPAEEEAQTFYAVLQTEDGRSVTLNVRLAPDGVDFQK